MGNLRWAKLVPPPLNTTLQTGKVGVSCYSTLPPQVIDLAGALGSAIIGSDIQAGPFEGLVNWLTTTDLPWATSGITTLLYDNPWLAPVFEDIVTSIDIGSLEGGSPNSEDCLFLNLVVPGSAMRKEKTLPDVNYIFGGDLLAIIRLNETNIRQGAYAIGSKDPIYNGYGLVRESNGSIIYAVGNYLLSAFGFLAGDTIDNDDTAVANAGFWDQRAILEWIRMM